MSPKGLYMAALGDYESVLPLQAVGIQSFIVKEDVSEVELGKLLHRLMDGQCAVVFVVEWLFEQYAHLIDEFVSNSEISAIPIPNVKGSRGIGAELIRQWVEQAVGMDIFS